MTERNWKLKLCPALTEYCCNYCPSNGYCVEYCYYCSMVGCVSEDGTERIDCYPCLCGWKTKKGECTAGLFLCLCCNLEDETKKVYKRYPIEKENIPLRLKPYTKEFFSRKENMIDLGDVELTLLTYYVFFLPVSERILYPARTEQYLHKFNRDDCPERKAVVDKFKKEMESYEDKIKILEEKVSTYENSMDYVQAKKDFSMMVRGASVCIDNSIEGIPQTGLEVEAQGLECKD